MRKCSQSVARSGGGADWPGSGRCRAAYAGRAFGLVAEADGNRTRQRHGTPLTGFEGRRRPWRRCSLACSAVSLLRSPWI
jgi:hypothetical protein